MKYNRKNEKLVESAKVVNFALVRASKKRYKLQQLLLKYFKRGTLAVLGVSIIGLLIFFDSNTQTRVTFSGDKNSKTQVIKVKADYQNGYVLRGFINDKPVVFLVDTGATSIAMSGTDAKILGLSRGQHGYSATAGGRVSSYATRLKVAQIGNIKITNLHASIIPKMKPGQILLGMNFLKHLTLNQNKGVLTITYNDNK